MAISVSIVLIVAPIISTCDYDSNTCKISIGWNKCDLDQNQYNIQYVLEVAMIQGSNVIITENQLDFDQVSYLDRVFKSSKHSCTLYARFISKL